MQLFFQVEDVVRQLSKRSELLHIVSVVGIVHGWNSSAHLLSFWFLYLLSQYLDALFVKDPQAAMDYHELQVK